MIDVYVHDIETSLKNKAYFSALALALTLPDTCGMAEFPNASVTERYINWYDTYIGNYEAKFKNEPYLSGEIVYNLRNTFLHTGSPNIDNKKVKAEVNQLDKFILILGDGRKIWSSTLNVDTPLASIKIMTINVTYFCQLLCDRALRYYNRNAEKFIFNFTIQHEDGPFHKLTEEEMNSDPLLDILNNKIKNSGNSLRLTNKPGRNMTKELVKNSAEGFTLIQQVSRYIDEHFDEEKYLPFQEFFIQIILESRTKRQVNNTLMKTFSSEETSKIYKKLKPLIKDLPGK